MAYFTTVLETRRSKCQQVSFLMGPLSLACWWWVSLESPRHLYPLCVCGCNTKSHWGHPTDFILIELHLWTSDLQTELQSGSECKAFKKGILAQYNLAKSCGCCCLWNMFCYAHVTKNYVYTIRSMMYYQLYLTIFCSFLKHFSYKAFDSLQQEFSLCQVIQYRYSWKGALFF